MKKYTSPSYPINTLLEKDLAKKHISINVDVFHNNDKPLTSISYSQSFSIDEIYKHLQTKYKNKKCYIYFIIN
jgi:hypothetical protein